MILGINRKMINVSTPTVVTAQHRPDDFYSVCRDPTQTRIALQKPADRLPIVTFGNVETLDPVPQLDSGIVIVDAKFTSLNLHCGEILAVDLLVCDLLFGVTRVVARIDVIDLERTFAVDLDYRVASGPLRVMRHVGRQNDVTAGRHLLH